MEDYGIGVAAEDRERMFAAYYRTPRAWGIPGSGLGLRPRPDLKKTRHPAFAGLVRPAARRGQHHDAGGE